MGISKSLEELQSVDLLIMRSKKELENIPEKAQIIALRKQKELVVTKKMQADAVKSSLDGEIRAFNLEVQTLKDKIAVEQERLNSSPDHRVVNAITKEIDGFSRRINKVEFDEIGLMEKSDKVGLAQQELQVVLDKIDLKESQLIQSYKIKGGELSETVAKEIHKRSEVAATLPDKLFQQYTKLLETKSGIAVSQLQNNTCSICRVTLSAAQVDKLKHSEEFGICPSCQRIMLLVKEN